MLKRITNANCIKYKFLGIPIKTVKRGFNTIKVKYFFITIWKIKLSKNKIKVYFCGLRIFSEKDTLFHVVTKHNPASNLQVKALEILNERKNIGCDTCSDC